MGVIKFDAIGSTLVNCSLIAYEKDYFSTLGLVDSYDVTAEKLILYWSDENQKGS